MRTYVILDPQHEYGVELVAAIRRRWGLNPIVVYSSSKEAIFRRSTYPQLEHNLVGRYCLDQTPLAAVADDIRRQGHVVQGVVPYFEQGILPMTELMTRLNVAWNPAETVARFRDKFALKQHVQKMAPMLQVGLCRQVDDAQAVFFGELPDAFVIKPNDGFANRDIGFFTRATPRSEIEAYFERNPGPAILEEQFFGTEYAVNGQMDHAGRAILVNITRYERTSGNGKPNLYHRTHHVPRHDPDFARLAAYAAGVMQATGLCRCPFHMELMMTPLGPRLIEVGARFGGTRYAFMSNDVHGGNFDVFALAAHYYLFGEGLEQVALDWDHYDRVHYIHLDGISHRDERIYSVEGVERVEALPEFRSWVVKPQVGGRLYRTLDLYQVPYSFHMMSLESDGAVREACERGKAALVFNRHRSLARRLLVAGTLRAKSVRLRGAWLTHRLAHRLAASGILPS